MTLAPKYLVFKLRLLIGIYLISSVSAAIERHHIGTVDLGTQMRGPNLGDAFDLRRHGFYR